MSTTEQDGGYTKPAERTSGLAIASLALGVIGFFALPVVASVLAIVLGRRAQSEIRTDPTVAGEGMAQAGVILGAVALVVAALFLLLAVLFLAAV